MPRRNINPNDFCGLVKNDYADYENLRAAGKATTVDPVVLQKRATNPAFIGQSPILHSLPGRDCYLEAEITDSEILKYSLKIFAPSFGRMPCFRLDSRGGDHINRDNGMSLLERIVPTPHFHRVDRDGWMMAYPITQSRDPQIAEAIVKNVALGAKFSAKNLI